MSKQLKFGIYKDGKWKTINENYVKSRFSVYLTDLRLKSLEALVQELKKIHSEDFKNAFKKELESLLREKKKSFRKHGILQKLKNTKHFWHEAWTAFDELVEDGLIIEKSRGWYRRNQVVEGEKSE